jgi:hypothetical protein
MNEIIINGVVYVPKVENVVEKVEKVENVKKTDHLRYYDEYV